MSMLALFNYSWLRVFAEGLVSSDATFAGFGRLIQLMETYRILIYIIGAVLFVISVVLILFPGARNFLGDWF